MRKALTWFYYAMEFDRKLNEKEKYLVLGLFIALAPLIAVIIGILINI